MKSNARPPTTAERKRIDAMLQLGCVLTWAKFGRQVNAECHHITVARKRLGHAYTIPLSSWYHRGVPDPGFTPRDMRRDYGASLADGSKAFCRSHGYTELDLWIHVQHLLGLDDELPRSKIVRRAYVAMDQNRVALLADTAPTAAAVSAEPSGLPGRPGVGAEA